MTRARALALAGTGAAGLANALLLAAWLAPDNVLALWQLVAFCG
ncbi:MAG: hypothetical protein ACJ8G1_02405 [Vitreoscilla sp.]